MAEALQIGEGTAQLSIGVFLVGVALAMLITGPLCDRFGRRRTLIVGLSLYFSASLACALASSIEALLTFRFLQALGACTGPVVGRAVVRDLHKVEDAARVLAIIGTAMALTPVVMPILGGHLVIWFGWRANFAFMAGAGGLVLATVLILLAETNVEPDVNALSPRRMARNYVDLLTDPKYLGYALSIAFSFGGIYAFISGSPFVLIEMMGVAPDDFGELFALTGVCYGVGGYSAARLTPRWGLNRTILIGMSICLAAVLTLNALGFAGVVTVAAIIAPMMANAIGIGLIFPNAQAGAISLHPHMGGAASAMLGFLQMTGAALAGLFVAAFHDGTQFPMILTTLGATLGMIGVFFALIWRRSHEPGNIGS